MSLLAATLLPGILLIALGIPLALTHSGVAAALKAFPRSKTATWALFGSGAAWFLYNVWNLSAADFGEYHVLLFAGFAIIAILAFRCVPDFLAVRGLCVLVLMWATPLRDAAYMEYDKPARLFMVSFLYLCIALAIWLGAQPWRMRDLLEWLFARPGRARGLGGFLAAYGLLLCVIALTY
jgi:hypothetical protein